MAEERVNSSAFWQAIRDVVKKVVNKEAGNSWPSCLVWSNLYKVAPFEGGNPGNTLCNIQLEGCLDLFKIELSTYAPQRLLLLTGLDWAAPFLIKIFSNLEQISISKDYAQANVEVEAVGQFKHSGPKTKIVVATHPQVKKRNQWVGEVSDAFKQP